MQALIFPDFKVRELASVGRIRHSVPARIGRSVGAGNVFRIAEAFRLPVEFDEIGLPSIDPACRPAVFYEADAVWRGKPGEPGKLRQAVHMPDWASRLWVRVASVAWQHPYDVTAADVVAEGIERVDQLGMLRACGWKDYQGRTHGFLHPMESFASWWDHQHGPNAWAQNPRICAMRLVRITPARQVSEEDAPADAEMA